MTKFAKINQELAEKVELQLPNGAILRSRYVYQKGKFWMSYAKVVANAKKEQMPLVGCLSSGSNQHLFAFDFDDPKKLPATIGTWDKLVQVLEDLPGFTVARSPSGKVKAFIVFNWAGFPHKQSVIERAAELLPENLRGAFDKMGAFQFYLSKEISDALKGLDESLVYDWSTGGTSGLDDTHSNIVGDRNSANHTSSFTYHLADIKSIPAELQPFINPGRKGSESRLKLCRILVAMFRLADKGGFSLPVASLAEQCGVDATTVSSWLSWLKKAGFLSCVSHSYIVGLKAKSYEARGPLLAAVKARKETYNYATTLPKAAPKDGEFYRYFLSLSKKVPVLRDFKLVINELPGIQLKGRYNMALKIFQHDRRKEGATA